MRKESWIGLMMLVGMVVLATVAGPAAAAENGTAAAASGGNISPGLIGLAAAIAIAATGLGTAWAMVNIGSAAVGAMAEDPDLFGQGLILTALPETVVLFGLVIGFLLVSAI